MKKLCINIIFIIFSFFVISCAQKPAPVTTWHEVIIIDVDTPSDDLLINNGMPSGFFLITPQSKAIRDNTYYYEYYVALVDEIFKDSIPVTYNERVEYYIEFFQSNYHNNFIIWLERSKFYMPGIKKVLASEGMPSDLAYLPLIESGYNPNAVSHANAVGMWQFISSTGKIYNLKIDNWQDERRNVEKATIAASGYLRDLYDEFGSWELALASYNCGEVRVRRTIKLADSNDFWEISRLLPRETRNYVPKYMAALIIAKNPTYFGFPETIYDDSPKLVKVDVPPEKSLSDIAKVTGYNPEELKQHNPSLTGRITPPGNNYSLLIEPGYIDNFENNKDQIASLKKVKPRTTTYKTYRVRNGDNLWLIARKHGVSVNSIKRTNRLKSNMIKPGQKLKIKKTTSYGSSSSSTYTASKSKNVNKKSTSNRTSSRQVYTVRKGETIGEIAENFGVGLSVLKRHNGLRSSNIRAGQKLKIPAGSKKTINYNIKSGDTLSEIADRYRVSVTELKKWNNLQTTKLTAGNNLKIYR